MVECLFFKLKKNTRSFFFKWVKVNLLINNASTLIGEGEREREREREFCQKKNMTTENKKYPICFSCHRGGL